MYEAIHILGLLNKPKGQRGDALRCVRGEGGFGSMLRNKHILRSGVLSYLMKKVTNISKLQLKNYN